MPHWTEDLKNQVCSWLGQEVNCVFIGMNLQKSNKSTTKVNITNNNRPDLILGYDSFKNLYAVWNPYLYQKQNFSVSIPYFPKENITGYKYFYSSLNNGKSQYGKKLLILPDYLELFCKNWRSYLKPNMNDHDFKKNKVLWADKFHPEPVVWEKFYESNEELVKRDKDIVWRTHRDYNFRKNVMKKYSHPQCCICRCDIEELLEAAHIEAVAERGSDSPDNGILLCRNHHKMFDAGMIKIDGESLEIIDERVTKMPWYHIFKEEFGGKVIKKNE